MNIIKSDLEITEEMRETNNSEDMGIGPNKVNKFDLLNSKELANQIKNLSKPNFLGSLHLKNGSINSFSSVDGILGNDLELKIAKSLKSSIFNPITKFLILLTIFFNLFWMVWYLF